ncbi:MAG: thioesterase family protein [Streptosporangiales bacterium]|nr:thioesterase family protein [Streptosporangiales bacterium]
MGYEFDVDTGVSTAGPGRYSAEITDRWHALSGAPVGGYPFVVALRALADAVPLPDPLAVSAHFLRPSETGPAEVRAETLRAGRRTATGQAALSQDGKERLRLTATFGDLAVAEGRTLLFGEPPALPAPDTLTDLLAASGLTGMSLLDRVEFRFGDPPGWLSGRPDGEPSCAFWVRFADGREPDTFALALFWDVMAPVVLDLGVPISTTLEATLHVRGRPAPGWVACRVASRYLTDGLCEEDMEMWDSAGALVAQSRQLTLLP